MAVDIKIELKNKHIDISRFSEAKIRKASMGAINQAIAQVKTLSIREVTKIYNLSAADVRPNILVLKASEANLTAKLLSSRRTIPIINFRPTEVKDGILTKFSGGRKTGSFTRAKTRLRGSSVDVNIFRENNVTIQDAFIFFGSSVNPYVKAIGEYDGSGFKRAYNGDGKATKLNTLSIAGALRNEKVVEVLRTKSAELYAKTYLSQLQNIGKF